VLPDQLPLTLGHEFAGHVVAIGDGVEGLTVGDAVAVEPEMRDNTCDECQKGHYNLCTNLRILGVMADGGGLAEYAVVPAYTIHRLPQGISTDIGALIEPIAVGWHAVRRAQARLGQTALVVGAGPIGLVTLLALKTAGLRWIAVSEVATARKRMAEQLGANVVLDPREVDVIAEVKKLTGGTGVDVAFDAAGFPGSLQTALRALRSNGTVVNIAVPHGPIELSVTDLMAGQKQVTASSAYAGDHPGIIAALVDGRLDPSSLITSRIALEDAVQGGFEELIAHADQQVKILIHP
jgi:(R,R)-butanediol dehydrogenase/meso-butanediol dehydrogenase/diacetyl reductase